jgi:hypothetical protein
MPRTEQLTMPEQSGPTPMARAFYSLNDLYDDLERMSDHEVNVLLSSINDRIQDSDRAAAIYAMVRAYQTRT